MVGLRKKRHTGNPLLLKRTKSHGLGNAIGGSTLYDVHEPRCGITVLPSIARDSHLVHIMQNSLSNNTRSGRNNRSRRASRVVPNRTGERLLSGMPPKPCKLASQPWRKPKLNATLSSLSLKRQDRSRASSTGYPSSWNYDITKEGNNEYSLNEVLHCDMVNHPVQKPRPKSIDTSVQCTLRRNKKQRKNFLARVAQTQTVPSERSFGHESGIVEMEILGDKSADISHTSCESNCPSIEQVQVQRQRAYSGEANLQSEANVSSSYCCLCQKAPSDKSSRSNCNDESCPYKAKQSKSTCTDDICPYKKNYGGYTPSETTYEMNPNNKKGKSSEVIEKSSTRFGRIEKISRPPSVKGKTIQQIPTQGRSNAEDETELPDVSLKRSKSENSEGKWRLRLASKNELKSYEQMENINVCSFVCNGNQRKGLTESKEQANGRNWQEETGNSSRQLRPDYQQELPSAGDICQCDQVLQKNSSTVNGNVDIQNKRKIKQSSYESDEQSKGRATNQSKPCRCVNADTQTLRHGTMDMLRKAEMNGSSKTKTEYSSSNYKTATVNNSGYKEISCDCDCPGCLKSSAAAQKDERKQKNQPKEVCRCDCPVCERLRAPAQKSSRSPTTVSRSDGLSSIKKSTNGGSPNKNVGNSSIKSFNKENPRESNMSSKKRTNSPANPKAIDVSLRRKSYFPENPRETDVSSKTRTYFPGNSKETDVSSRRKAYSPENLTKPDMSFKKRTLSPVNPKTNGVSSRRKTYSPSNPKANVVSSKRKTYSPDKAKANDVSSKRKSYAPDNSRENDVNSKRNFNSPSVQSLRRKDYYANDPKDFDLSSVIMPNNKDSPNRVWCYCNCPNCQCAQGNGMDFFGWNGNQNWNVYQCNHPDCTGVQYQRDMAMDINGYQEPYQNRMQFENNARRQMNGNSNRRSSSTRFVCKCTPVATQTSQSAFMTTPLMQDVCSEEECDFQCEPCELAGKETNPNTDEPPSHCSCTSSASELSFTSEKSSGPSPKVSNDKQPINNNSNYYKASKNKEIQCCCNCPNCGVRLDEFSVYETDNNTIMKDKRTKIRQGQTTPRATTTISKDLAKRKSISKQDSTKAELRTRAVSTRTESRTEVGKLKKEPIMKSDCFCEDEQEFLSKQKAKVKRQISDFCTNETCTDNVCGQCKINAARTREISPGISDFCNDDNCSNNVCEQCTVTPAKRNSDEAMVNMVINDKCNVNQIIEILHETVAGLEQQKKLLSQAAAAGGNATLRGRPMNPNGNDSNSNDNNETTAMNNNANGNEWSGNQYNNNNNAIYYANSNNNNHMRNGTPVKPTIPRRCRQQQKPSSCITNICPVYRQGYQGCPQGYPQPRQNICYGKKCYGKGNPFVLPNACIFPETQYHYPKGNNNANYDADCDCDCAAECCPTANGLDNDNDNDNNNYQSEIRKRSGSAYPFEDNTKTCPSLTFSEIKAKTLQSCQPTKSFFNLLDMALFLNKNRKFMKNNMYNCKLPNRTQRLGNKHCLKSREHYEYLQNKSTKHLDIPMGPNSYERNILQGFEKLKAECKASLANDKCEKCCTTAKDLMDQLINRASDDEYSEDISKCPCQVIDKLKIEELCRRQARPDYLYREHRKPKDSRRQREQSKQTDLSTKLSHDHRDSSACGLAFCRGCNGKEANEQSDSSRNHTNQCECDCDMDFYRGHNGKDKRFPHTTGPINPPRCPGYSSDCSDSRQVIDRGPRRYRQQVVYRERDKAENKLRKNCLCTKVDFRMFANKQNPKRKPSIIFPSFNKTIKENKTTPKEPKTKYSEDLKQRDKTKLIPSDLFPCFNRKKSEKSDHPKKLEPKRSEESKGINLFPCVNNKKKEMKEKPNKPEQKPSKDLEEAKKPKKKSSSLFPCFNMTKREKFENPKEPQHKLSKDLQQAEKPKQKSSNLFHCFNRTSRENKEKIKEPQTKYSKELQPKPKPKKKSSNLFPCFHRLKKEKKEKLSILLPKTTADLQPCSCFIQTNRKLMHPEAKPSKDLQEQKPKQTEMEKEQPSDYPESKPKTNPLDGNLLLKECVLKQSEIAPECCACDDNEVKVLYDSSYKFCKNRNEDTTTDCDCDSREALTLPHERHNQFFSMFK